MPVEYKWYKNGELITLDAAHSFISDYYVSQASTDEDKVNRQQREQGDWSSWLAIEVATRYPTSIKKAIKELQEGVTTPVITKMTDEELLQLYCHLDQNGYKILYWQVWK